MPCITHVLQYGRYTHIHIHVNTLLDQRDQTHAKHIHFHIISLIYATGVTSKAVMSIYAQLLAMSTLYTYCMWKYVLVPFLLIILKTD